MNPCQPIRGLHRLTLFAAFTAATLAICQGEITYVDAIEGPAGNTYATGSNSSDLSWIDTTTNSTASNNSKWMKRSAGNPGWTQNNGGTIFQASISANPNNIPEVTTELSGLSEGTYEVWAFFWEKPASTNEDWVLDAGLTSGALSSYSAPTGPLNGTDSTTPVNANTLAFANAPAVVAANGNQEMFGVKLGQVVVTGGSSIVVHVDKLAGIGGDHRTIYDGIGYELQGPPPTDSDGDGLPDSFEQMIIDADPGDAVTGFADVMGTGASPVVTDFDGDGADDAEEQAEGTDPLDEDTDDDGYHDGAETNDGTFGSYDPITHTGDTGTDPLKDDSDADGLLDGVESNSGTFVDSSDTGTSPLDPDSDNDGTNDGIEVAQGTDPANPSSNLTNVLIAIDFNRNDALGSPSQSLFRVVAGSTSQASNPSTYTKAFGSRQVTISQPGAIDFEFRGANTDSTRAIPGGDISRSFLVADFIATRGGAIDLQFSGLAAGTYTFRSYHLDTFTGSAHGFAQGATTTTSNTIEARMSGLLQASVQATSLGASGLNTTFIDDTQVPTLAFSFSHDGTGPATIELRSTHSNGSDNFLLINGFELFQAAP